MLTATPGKKGKIIALAVVALILVILATAMSFQYTSRTEFCISCHEMKANAEEMLYSKHAVDKDKKKIECWQCHVPINFGIRYLVVKTYVGLKDVVVHFAYDMDKLDRRMMQMIGKRFVPDENCLACHPDLTKNLKNEKISEIGRLSHEAYSGKNGNTKSNCSGCHTNMAHLPQFDRHYDKNAEFAKKLAEKKSE